MLFYATVKPDTGKMWCPDCVYFFKFNYRDSDPVIDEGFKKHPDCTVVVCPIPRDGYKVFFYIK